MGEAMGAIGLAEAARLTGRNQSSIHRAMKAGRLSYTRNEAGERRIDIAELERVFGIKSRPGVLFSHGNGASPGNDAATDADYVRGRTGGAATVARGARAHNCGLARDYRARLDAEAQERREAERKLTALLTHRQAGSVPALQRTVSEPRLPWWQKWFR
jgi:hypothetical protein